jgi:hypothetical protein
MSLITTDITMDSVRPLCPSVGLSQREAEKRLQQVGPNDPSPCERGELLLELLVLFVNPLVMILLIAVLISIVLGQVTDAAIIFVFAMFSVAINFIQTYRSDLALPWSPLVRLLGFTALPLPFFLFLGISTITYLLLVEAAKRKFFPVSHRQPTSLAEAAE